MEKWSSRLAHNQEVGSSNLSPATSPVMDKLDTAGRNCVPSDAGRVSQINYSNMEQRLHKASS